MEKPVELDREVRQIGAVGLVAVEDAGGAHGDGAGRVLQQMVLGVPVCADRTRRGGVLFCAPDPVEPGLSELGVHAARGDADGFGGAVREAVLEVLDGRVARRAHRRQVQRLGQVRLARVIRIVFIAVGVVICTSHGQAETRDRPRVDREAEAVHLGLVVAGSPSQETELRNQGLQVVPREHAGGDSGGHSRVSENPDGLRTAGRVQDRGQQLALGGVDDAFQSPLVSAAGRFVERPGDLLAVGDVLR
ncbi:hypothetical protein AB0N20_02925 [Streptomyces griseoincarnatus]